MRAKPIILCKFKTKGCVNIILIGFKGDKCNFSYVMMNLCRILFLKLLNIFQKRMKGTHGNDASVFESIMKLKGEMI